MDVRELSHDDCRLAHAAMRELRPQVGDEPAFVERVRSQFAQGYRLIGAFDGQHEHAALRRRKLQRCLGDSLPCDAHEIDAGRARVDRQAVRFAHFAWG